MSALRDSGILPLVAVFAVVWLFFGFLPLWDTYPWGILLMSFLHASNLN